MLPSYRSIQTVGFYARRQFKAMHLASDRNFTGLETCPFKPSQGAWLGGSFYRGSVGEWVDGERQAGRLQAFCPKRLLASC